MKSAVLFLFLCGIWASMLFCSTKAEEKSLDKRYIAALAKNNRLPKFSYIHKKSEESDDEPSMEDTMLFLNEMVRPDILIEKVEGVPSFPESSQDDFLESSPLSKFNILSDQTVDKRNIAALARLGRLNTIRYGRFQPHYVSGKRVTNENSNDEDNQEIITNEIFGNDIECETYDEDEETIDDEVNGRQKKRYVAALARSGRLPIWHSQRMWSGKRDYTYPLYKNSRMDIENDLDNYIDEIPSYRRKQKKCKKINQLKRQKRDVDKTDEIKDIAIENINFSGPSNQKGKRNLAVFDRNDELPLQYFENDKSNENMDGNNMSDFFSEEKKNIASLARNGKLFSSRLTGKRNLAALARNGKLLQSNFEGKRNIAALARNGKLLVGSKLDDKRNVPSLEKSDILPSFVENKGKRYIAALARNNKLPALYDKEGKRNLAALARNGKLPSFYNGNDKRNIQALARDNKLPAFSNDKRDSMESDDKRNLAALAKNGRLPSFAHIDDKRNLAALAKNGKLPSFYNVDDKRNLAALARNGKLPTFVSGGKRNIAALARNGKLPMFDSREDKRNIAALAKNGKLPSFYSSEEKRNVAALAKNGKLPSFYSSGEKRNIAALAKNGKLPSFYPSEDKRNIAALARNGKIPTFTSIEEKREIVPVSRIYDEENKRNIAALARKGHLMHFVNQGKKRNIAALARNGKLLEYNKRDIYTSDSLNPLEKWDDMIFQDDIEK